MAEFKCLVVLMSCEAIRWARSDLGPQDLDTGECLRQQKQTKQKKNSLSLYVLLECSSLERINFKMCQSPCACQ